MSTLWIISFLFQNLVVGYLVKFIGGEGCKCDDNQKAGQEAKLQLDLILAVFADPDFLLHSSDPCGLKFLVNFSSTSSFRRLI